MDKTDYETIKDYYDRLEGLKESGEIVNVYGGFEADAEVLGDFAEFFYVHYKDSMPDWINAYMQLHAWQFQRYHEGVDTYYKNLYENTDYGSILRAAEYWAETGHEELAERLKALAYEGAEDDSCPCPIEDYGKLIAETEEWIDDNEECIFDCYLEILLDNKNSLLAALKEDMVSAFWEQFKPLYAVEILEGYTENEIGYLKELFGILPQVLEDYYRAAGRTKAFHCVQDTWMLPEHFQKWGWLRESDYLILLNENQGVCRAGICREDLMLPDPPVYVTDDDKNWTLCAPTTSEFLSAALAYEGVFTFEYNPEEFYWLTEVELELIQSKLTKLPFELASWLCGMRITLYNNESDNMVAVMDCGDLQMLYGAASEASYARLMAVLEGVGEAI